MTIWKAISILSGKLVDYIRPCRHVWKDEFVLNEFYERHQYGKKMVQRCSECGKYRRLKMY